ncbi:MAG: glycosyltransferase family 2 protein [Erysipelotrichaceae bacterium]|jgi:glycosyltransferase involved in cell wall biosynthesis
MVKISFIIPIYNGEKYIDTCLKSILKVNNIDFEVILVNDGSTDSTEEKIKEYVSKDSRVKGYDNGQNKGLSMTRNNGLKQASGEYINFIDVDDYITDDYFKVIYEAIKTNQDLYVFGYNVLFIDENYSIKKQGINKTYINNTKDELLKDMFELDVFNFAWNKLYKKEILEGVLFSDDFYQGEDLAFNCEVIKKCKTVSLLDDCLYVYIKRNVETMASKFVKNYDIVLNNKYNILYDLFKTIDINNKYRHIFDDYMLKEYEVFVINLYKTKDYKDQSRIKLIKENILNEIAIKQINNSTPKTAYSKLFKNVVKFGNPNLINVIYKNLYSFKNNFGKIYLKLRKKIYLIDDKKSS